jgi:hypothetical protein
MRGATVLILGLLLAAVPQAFALGAENCEARLTATPAPREVREVFLTLQKLGLNSLLSGVYDQQIRVSTRKMWSRLQPAVSARINVFGRKNIVIRKIDIGTPALKQKFTWDIALALYELQMQPWLWSKDSVFSSSAGSRALPVNEDDDALAYFALQMPKEWRDQYLNKAQSMLRELYALFLTLPDLRSEDLMAAEDPGRRWILNAIFMKNSAHAIAPNQADFEILKSKGALQLERSVTAHNSRGVLFNYYMNHVKRMVIATFLVTNVALAPHLLEIPSYFEAQQEWSKYEETLNQAPTRAEVTELKTIEHQREREIRRLSDEIAIQEKKAERNDVLINRLKAQLQENIERAAGPLYTSEPFGSPDAAPAPR